MKKNISLILFLGAICLASACRREDCHKTITLRNNSGKTIYAHEVGSYRDTLNFTTGFPNPIKQDIYRIEAQMENSTALWRGECYEGYIGGIFIPSGVFFIYVFDEEVLTTVPWDSIGKYNIYLYRYELTLEDLQRLNWHITYPPGETMKSIKMHPHIGNDTIILQCKHMRNNNHFLLK